MQLKDLFLKIPRTTIATLTKYRILPQNILVWYDIVQFFDSLDTSPEAQRRRLSKLQKPLSQMEKYIITGEKYHLSDEQTRKIINRMNRYI